MNKINSAGLNLISRVKENKNTEELVSKKEILTEQNNVLKQNNLLNEKAANKLNFSYFLNML